VEFIPFPSNVVRGLLAQDELIFFAVELHPPPHEVALAFDTHGVPASGGE